MKASLMMACVRKFPTTLIGIRFGSLRLLALAGALAFSSAVTVAGDVGWTWESGSPVVTAYVNYGDLGVPRSSNSPGARDGSATWTDADGNLWLFGGWLKTEDDLVSTNDVWMYNRTTKLWTWIAGSSTPEIAGNYGQVGIESPGRFPGSRRGSSAWVDSSGKVWIFGGRGLSASRLNDLWRFDPVSKNWTWMSGSNSADAIGVYNGTNSAHPGARSSAASWLDGSGNLWLFGGEGFGTSSGSGALADLWKYDPSTGNWTYVKGSSSVYDVAVTGDQGVAATGNMPGGVTSAITWNDSTSLWFYGGFGKVAGGYGGYYDWLNDLWKYDISSGNWTWMKGTNELGAIGVYGSKGVAAAANRPGSRSSSASWVDSAGNFWMYGGYGYTDDFSDSGYLADTWKYTPGTNNWTWMGGSLELTEKPAYGNLNVANAGNNPGSRNTPLSWAVPGGNGWVYSGEIFNYDGTELWWSDLWEFNSASAQWTWRGGPKPHLPKPDYGSKGIVSSSNQPGARTGAATWQTADGDLWMLGGGGIDTSSTLGLLNDLWRFDPDTGNWVWVTGSETEGAAGRYGQLRNTQSFNMLPGRRDAVTWTGNSGDFWVFGGYAVRDIEGSRADILRNDLWKFNPVTKLWTWMAGGQYNQDLGVYGTKGEPHNDNTPGARESSVSWKDSDGNLWLFGGFGTSATALFGSSLNDLWKYNPTTNQWTWMHGSNAHNTRGTYGEIGVAAVGNSPGARKDAVSWTDLSGNFWLFGGYGYAESGFGDLNDLWMYQPSSGGGPSMGQWTWVAGSKVTYRVAVYGAAGSFSPLNTPGARQQSAT